MKSVIKLTSSMFEEVYETLLRALNPQIARETWQNAFLDRHWSDEDYHGFVLTDDGKIVGMLGTLFSQREIDGTPARFCNLHSWYVQPEYRTSSLLLMRAALSLKGYTLTDFSASPEVLSISKRLGFQRLDDELIVMPRLPWSGAGRAELIDLANEPQAAERWLTPGDRRIFEDHRHLDCTHVVVRSGSEYCYVVASFIESYRIAHSNVHYISNPALFVRHHATLRAVLLRRGGHYVAIDSRLLPERKPPLSLRAGAQEKLVRPDGVQMPKVDSLYSEMAILKLPSVPRAPERLRGVVRRFRSLGSWRRQVAS